MNHHARTSANPTFLSWRDMMRRCYSPRSATARANYADRGITVCDRWHSLENFVNDMGPRPAGLTLDRINNDGNYEPGNCRWATRAEQNGNRRSVRWLVFNGERRSVADWARATGVPAFRIYHRLYAGWSIERALSTEAAR